VFPSEDDDVVTSPYNALLSLSKLVEFADCVLPIENQALAEIVGKVDGGGGRGNSASTAIPAASGMVQEPGSRCESLDAVKELLQFMNDHE
jgi:tubulin epsilon